MDLKARLIAWMSGGEGDFSTFSLEIFEHQFEKNLAYRNYCESLGKSPQSVSSWHEIPAVPTDVFKLSDISLRCFSASEVSGYFLTSGTTQEIRGKHEYRDLSLYAASVRGTWRELGLPTWKNPWFLSQSPSDAPYSSLIRMFSLLDPQGTWLIDKEGKISIEKFQAHEAPNAIFGTSLAFLEFAKQFPVCQLPKGSWILETGGAKGLDRSFSAERVREEISCQFGVSESRILNEYGMTELFSQFYRWGGETNHRGAPWTAVRVVDLKTGKLAKRGEMGYLEILDLANLESVQAIRTQDFAIAVGDREFILLGRDAQAVAKGCSREVDWLLKKAKR